MLSVIIPVYKKEDTLYSCLSSVVNQNYNEYEIVLIDDGSPDRCGDICEEFQKKYNNIKVIHKKNEGVSIARNVGIEKACGDFICFVDADDTIKPDFLSELMRRFRDDVDVVVGSNRKNEKDFEKTITSIKGIEYMFDDDNFGVNVWGKIYRRRVIKDNCFPNGVKMGEDMYMLFYTLDSADKIVYTSYAGYEQHISLVNSSNSCNLEDTYKTITFTEKFLKYVKNRGYGLDVAKSIEVAQIKRCVWLANEIIICNEYNEKYIKEVCNKVKEGNKKKLSINQLGVKYWIASKILSRSFNTYRRVFSRRLRND